VLNSSNRFETNALEGVAINRLLRQRTYAGQSSSHLFSESFFERSESRVNDIGA